MDWEEKPEVKKGSIGEKIVNEILTKLGYIVYRPITGGAHKIDFFAHKSGAEKKVIAVEAKAKKRMAIYTSTGFNYSNYLHYKEIQEDNNMDTYVYFIDDFEGCVYGAWLSDLGEGKRMNTKYGCGVIVWDLSKMQLHRKLTPEEIREVAQYTKDNYDYSRVEKYFDEECFDSAGLYKYINK